MTVVCHTLGMGRRTRYYLVGERPSGCYQRAEDAAVLQQIRAVTNSRATDGYRPGVGDGEPDLPHGLRPVI